MKKIVSNQISPNLFLYDWFYAGYKTFLGKKCEKKTFEQFFNTKQFLLCNTARSALWKICEMAAIPKEKKIGIPAFVCAVVATPFLDQGYQIEWIDTDSNGLLCVNDLQKKQKNIGAVVVPHIFGQKANIVEIKKICVASNILMIEDCAHYFNPTEPIIADVRVASFGREKVFSCVSGGGVFWNTNSRLNQKLSNFTPKKHNSHWEFQHWMQIFWYSISLPWWNWGGKIIPAVIKKLNGLPLAVSSDEKNGKFNQTITQLAPKQQWILQKQLLNQAAKTTHNQAIAQAWHNLLCQYFPSQNIIQNNFRVILKTNNSTQQKLLTVAQKYKFYLKDWDGHPIAPAGVNLSSFRYQKGQCPKAEAFAKTYVTFPVNLRTTKKDVQRFKQVLEKVINTV